MPASHDEARDAALARLRESTPPKRKRPLLVQKVQSFALSLCIVSLLVLNLVEVDFMPPYIHLLIIQDHGRFDSLDFSVLAIYGSDYVQLRERLEANRLDLISAFLNQDEVHVLRAVEPTLRLRSVLCF